MFLKFSVLPLIFAHNFVMILEYGDIGSFSLIPAVLILLRTGYVFCPATKSAYCAAGNSWTTKKPCFPALRNFLIRTKYCGIYGKMNLEWLSW